MKSKQLDDISIIAHIYVETEYLDYDIAIEKAKELIGSERVGAHVNSDSINSKTIKNSISLDKDIHKKI